MDRRCVAREIGEGGVIRSRTNVSGLWVELMWLLAIMDISAHSISLAAKPRVGCSGHQFSNAPGRPLLHLFLSLSQTSAGKSLADHLIRPAPLFDLAVVPSLIISLVRPRRGLSPAPTAGCRGRRAQMLSRLAALQRPPAGSALTAASTTARWPCRGLRYAGWDIGADTFLTSKLRP